MTPQEQNDLIEKEVKSAQIKAIKIMKKFSKLIAGLPDDFEMSQDALDVLLKPLTEEIYKEIIEDEGCLYDITSAVDLIGVVLALSLKRCKNRRRASCRNSTSSSSDTSSQRTKCRSEK